MSLAFSSCSKSGLSGPAEPVIASTTWPPATGPVLAIGKAVLMVQPVSRKRAARTRVPHTRRRLPTLPVGLEPDVGDRCDQEDGGQHPRRVVELALQAAPGAVPAAQPA